MDITKILKFKPLGTKLYTPLIGEVYLKDVINEFISVDESQKFLTNLIQFDEQGRYMKKGEMLLFPSKEMRDWESFAWEEGDILTSPVEDENFVRFWKWNDDSYTTFKIKTLDEKCCDSIVCKTSDYIKVNEEEKQKLETKYFRPGQKVLVRFATYEIWCLDFFSHYDSMDKPICVGNRSYTYTIPYKGNQHLLGTTKEK